MYIYAIDAESIRPGSNYTHIMDTKNNTGQSFFKFLHFGSRKASEINSHLSTARSKVAQNDHQGAIEDFNKAIEVDPDNSVYYAERGYSKAALQDYPGAIADYNKAIELRPEFTKCFYFARGDAKSYLQDYQGAVDDYTKSMELRNCPESAPIGNDAIYYRRGLSKIELGQMTSGCSDLKKAADSGHADAGESLKKYCP